MSDWQYDFSDMNSKPKNEPLNLEPIEDCLSSEILAAGAIDEMIEEDRQIQGLLPGEKSTRPPQIDPRFQEDYNNI